MTLRELLRASAAAALLAAACPALGGGSARDMVLADGERFAGAQLQLCKVDRRGVSAEFLVDGKARDAAGFVRWGEPPLAVGRVALVLADGGVLCSDRPWSPKGLVRFKDGTVFLRRGKTEIGFESPSIRWMVLAGDSPGFDFRVTRQPPPGEEDVVVLASGDRLSGRLLELGPAGLRIDVAGEPIETPLEAIVAVGLVARTDARREGPPAAIVGLDDGSLLEVSRIELAEEGLTFNAVGVEVHPDPSALAFVQPLAAGVRYLSDLEPVDYRHTPYLDLAWPLARDVGLRGESLAGGGRRAVKGLAMHSAARVVYRLDGAPKRFQADFAVAEASAGLAPTGSVVGRVYLAREGKFEPAFDSGLVRGGEPSRPVDVDLTGAAGLALVIDYGGDGDAGDRAVWLDARLTTGGRAAQPRAD